MRGPSGGDVAVPSDIRKAVGYGALGFGALAVLSPRRFLGIYGMPDESNVRLMTRVWGTRTTVLGALTLMLDSRTLGSLFFWGPPGTG